MANKNYTLMFLPHAEANFKKIQISRNRVILIFASVVLFLCFTFYIFYSHVQLHMQLADYEKVKENEQKLASILAEKAAKIDQAAVQVTEQTQMLRKLGESVLNIGMGGDMDIGKGSNNRDQFSEVFNDLHSDLSTEFLSDFEMKLNQFEKENEFFNILYSRVSLAYDNSQELVCQMPSICPAEGWISSHFGYRRDPFTGKRAFHHGLDISNMDRDVPIVAAADGEVIYAGRDGGYGRTVTLNHKLTQFKTRYAHLSEILVKNGQQVKRGDRIGTMGRSGRSTGIHLHYEIIFRNKTINPVNYILNKDILVTSRYH